MRKAITCHAGARDDYQLSLALHEVGCLERLVTDAYLPDFLRGRIEKRHNPHLPSRLTTSKWTNLLRTKLLGQDFAVTDPILSRHAFRLAEKLNADLFLTSYTASDAFEMAADRNPMMRRYLFQIHPHPKMVQKILTEELDSAPDARDSILAEHEMRMSDTIIENLDRESRLADRIAVASSFTKQSLIGAGISEERIEIAPYGVSDDKLSLFKNKNRQKNARLRVLFLGQMVQRKGLSYLLSAVRGLKSQNIELTLVGRGRFDTQLLSHFSDIKFALKKNLSVSELNMELASHDVMVMPSLVEGFGHSIIESMASGLPVITTQNTAAPDLFVNGNEGFIVPVRDVNAIAEALNRLAMDPALLNEMSASASKTARNFTWLAHREKIKLMFLNWSREV